MKIKNLLAGALTAALTITAVLTPQKLTSDSSAGTVTAISNDEAYSQSASPRSSGLYSISPKQTIVYSQLPADDKMIGWEWSKFSIPATEKVSKVEINISASQNIGKWQGAFGSSTTVAPDYWTQTGDMEQSISGNSGTITWNVDAAASNIIQYQYGGQLKFGIWWIDCGTFTVDSINVYTGSGSSTPTTPAVTTAPAVTAAPPSSVPSASGGYSISPKQTIVYSQLPADDKMIGWEWSKFGIPAKEKVSKVEIHISASQNIGKWQGAFGSSTTVAPGYWTQTGDMEQSISGNSGTITWNVDAATANIIQYQYGGQLKFGIWWIDCGTFTVDSINVYTSNGSTTPTTPVTTTTTSTAPSSPVPGTTTTMPVSPNPGNPLAGDANGDGKVNVRDAAYIASKLAKGEELPMIGDFNGDGKVNVRDAAAIAKYLASNKK